MDITYNVHVFLFGSMSLSSYVTVATDPIYINLQVSLELLLLQLQKLNVAPDCWLY